MSPGGRADHPDIERLIDQAWRLRHDDTRRARGMAGRALAMADQRGDAPGKAWASLRVAVCDFILAEDTGSLERVLWRCVEAMRALDDRPGEAEALNLLGNVLASLSRHDEAMVLHRRCEALRLALGDENGVAGSLNNLAVSLRALGRHDDAASALHDSLRLAAGRGDSVGIAYARVNLGHVEMTRARPATAAREFELGFAAAARTEDRALECTALTGLATARVANGDHAGAREVLAHAQALAQRTGNVRDAARVCLAWARLELAEGRPAAAQPHLQAARQEAERAQDRELLRELQAVAESLRPPAA